MDKILNANRIYNSNLRICNLVSCLYLPAVIFWLNLNGSLYNIGKCDNFYIVAVLFTMEVLKYIFCYCKMDKTTKFPDPRKYKFKDYCKSIGLFLLMTVLIYIVAVLFGAPFLSKQEETMMFTMYMSIFTVLPPLLHYGPESVSIIFTSLTSYEGVDSFNKFLMHTRLTIFGAWLGSIIIPLDWNRPYQDWPIPCCLGALGGYFISNLITILLTDDKIFYKKPQKFNL